MILIRLFFQMYKYLIECYTIVILNVTFLSLLFRVVNIEKSSRFHSRDTSCIFIIYNQ